MSFTQQISRIFKAGVHNETGYASWPVPAGTGAAASGGVILTPGAGAWGASVDIIATAAIAAEHWIGGVYMFTTAAFQVTECELIGAAAAAVTPIIAAWIIDPTAATLNISPFWFPFPIRRPAGAATSGRVGCPANTGLVAVGLMVAQGL